MRITKVNTIVSLPPLPIILTGYPLRIQLVNQDSNRDTSPTIFHIVELRDTLPTIFTY